MADRPMSEQFDERLSALLAGSESAAAGEATELAALLAIARDLRDLPRESFKSGLKSELERKSSMATVAETATRVQTATPRLRVRNAAAAIEFYKRAFGAKELMRFEVGGEIPHAELQVGNAHFAVGEAAPDAGYPGPETFGGSPVSMTLSVEDAHAAVDRALAAGGKLTRPVNDEFYGDRVGHVLDPFGYTWAIQQRIEELSIEEMHRRLDAMMSQAPAKESGVSPIPKGYRTITPYLVAKDAAALIDFVKQTFGAEETFRTVGSAGGIHCEVRVGDAMMMIGGGGPGLAWKGDPMPTGLHVYVEDVDRVHARGMDAGGEEIQPPTDQPYGERGGSLKDPAGNNWYIATHKGPSYIPEGLHSVNVYLHPPRVDPFISFVKRAFGAVEVARYPTPEGLIPHAAVRIGDSVLEMGEGNGPYQPMPTMFYLYVPNVDGMYQRALNAGATSISEPKDQPYGDRSAGVKDVWGNQWYIATHVKDMPA